MIPEAFKKHELWETLDKTLETYNQLDPEALTDAQKDILDNRLPKILASINLHRSNASGFYSENMMQRMKNPWVSIQGSLTNFSSSPGHYANQIGEQLDQVLQVAATWPTVFSLKGSAVSNSIKLFEKSQEILQQRITSLEQKIVSKNEEIIESDKKFELEKQNLNEKITELEGAIEKNETEIQNQRENISQLSVDHNETFKKAQEDRQKEYKNWLKEKDQEYGNDAQELLDDLSSKTNEGDELFKELVNLREDVEKVAHGATAVILARDYGKASTRDYVVGILFMALGVTLLAAAGLILFFSFSAITPGTQITWQWTALKVTSTLLVTAGATFSFRFSQNFLSNASRTKRSDLELRAINPFLETLNDPTLSDQTKVDFINRAFGQSDTESNSKNNNSADESVSQKELIELLLSFLKQNQ